MLDLVPLTRARWEMTDRERPRGFIGELLEFPLPQPEARPVAATGVCRDDDPVRRRIQEPSFSTPPAPNGGDRERPRVVVGPDVDEALVPPDVVDAVWKRPGHRGTLEVMAVHGHRLLDTAPLTAGIRVVAQ